MSDAEARCRRRGAFCVRVCNPHRGWPVRLVIYRGNRVAGTHSPSDGRAVLPTGECVPADTPVAAVDGLLARFDPGFAAVPPPDLFSGLSVETARPAAA